MKALAILFLISAFCGATAMETHYNETIILLPDSHWTWFVYLDNQYVQIVNANEFPDLQAGDARVSYETEGDQMKLLSYEFIPDPQEAEHDKFYRENPGLFQNKATGRDDSKIYNAAEAPFHDKNISVFLYRVVRRGLNTCVSLETANRYLYYLELYMQVITTNRCFIDYQNTHVSDVCCPCPDNDNCYNPNNYSKLPGYVPTQCDSIGGFTAKTSLKPMTRIFLATYHVSGVGGIASVGTASNFVNRAGNYYANVYVDYDIAADDLNGWANALGYFIHEVNHNFGFGHGSLQDYNTVNFAKQFIWPDNYLDYGNIMGSAFGWDTPAGPYHYYTHFTIRKAESYHFRYASKGVENWRLLSYDHPFSRVYLGREEPRYADSDMIEGEQKRTYDFGHHGIVVEVPWHSKIMASTMNPTFSYASLFLEYRYKSENLYGAANRSLRIVQGFHRTETSDTAKYAGNVLLHAKSDQLGVGVADSSIPPGVMWVAPDADLGTFGVQITRVNTYESGHAAESTVFMPPQPLSSIPHIEFTTYFLPNVRYITPRHPAPLPTLVTSPNMDCTLNADNSGYTCLANYDWFWWYIERSAHTMHPRVYSSDKKSMVKACGNFVASVVKEAVMSTYVVYGDYSRQGMTMTITKAAASTAVNTLHRTSVYEVRATGAKILTFYGNIVVFTKVNVPAGGKAVLQDSFGAQRQITVDSSGNAMAMLKEVNVQHMGAGFLNVYNSNGAITNRYRFYTRKGQNTNPSRPSWHIDDASYVTLSHSVRGTMQHYVTAIEPREVQAGEWVNVMFDGGSKASADDFVYIDFTGAIPENFVIHVESDSKIHTFDCKRFAGIEDFTLKVTRLDLMHDGAFYGNVARIRVSHPIIVEAVRPITKVVHGSWGGTPAAVTADITISGQKYNYVSESVEAWGFVPFAYSFGDKEYQFADLDATHTIFLPHDPATKNPPWMLFLVIFLVALLVLVAVYAIYWLTCKKRSVEVTGEDEDGNIVTVTTTQTGTKIPLSMGVAGAAAASQGSKVVGAVKTVLSLSPV